MVGHHEITCGNCGRTKKQTKSAKGKYCSIQCQQDDALRKRASMWVTGQFFFPNRVLRRIIGLMRGYKCDVCGLSSWNGKEVVLEVEHRDGNSENCSPDNVCLICPNCHSQTETYKGKNRGKGRHYRRMRYAEGKSY